MIDDRGHEAGGFVYDCVYASLPEFERATATQRRSATRSTPAQFVSDPQSGLELSYDGAYWVSRTWSSPTSRPRPRRGRRPGGRRHRLVRPPRRPAGRQRARRR